MRLAWALMAMACSLCAQTADAERQAVIRTVERTFQAMASRDAAALAGLLLPGARLFAIRPDGIVSVSSGEDFAARIAGMKEVPLERIWNPDVRVSGRLATLWAESDFHRDGQFSHCGVDAIQLLRTPEGWKIAGIAYTVQKEGCTPGPPGPPAGRR